MRHTAEIAYSREDFKELQKLAIDHVGIVLNEHKFSMVYNRLVKRLRELQLASFEEYILLLRTKPENEIISFINCITTNVTYYFRENHHFTFLQHVELPRILYANNFDGNVRIWSAGCSTGEEPYSIAIAAKEILPHNVNLTIIATDIDSDVLNFATKAVYPESSTEKISVERLKYGFLKGIAANATLIKVKPAIRKCVNFVRHNLLEDNYRLGKFNIIFCRNVLIYFNHEKKKEIVERFAECLTPGGVLILGHAESLYGISERFQLISATIYRKAA